MTIYIFVYTITESNNIKYYLNLIKKKYNFNIKILTIKAKNQIQEFIYGIIKCKAVITDSFHGTIFSLIFNKPFISFVYESKGIERFNTLKEIFNFQNRIYDWKSKPDLKLLNIPLNINKTLLNSLRDKA